MDSSPPIVWTAQHQGSSDGSHMGMRNAVGWCLGWRPKREHTMMGADDALQDMQGGGGAGSGFDAGPGNAGNAVLRMASRWASGGGGQCCHSPSHWVIGAWRANTTSFARLSMHSQRALTSSGLSSARVWLWPRGWKMGSVAGWHGKP